MHLRTSLALSLFLIVAAACSWPAITAANGGGDGGGTTGPARFVGAYTWSEKIEGFGGFSALELSPDGQRFTLLSDRGRIGTGRLGRDQSGRVTSVRMERFLPLLGTEGEALSRHRADAEGLAIRPDGRIYISFEGAHRVWTYARPGGEAAWLPRHPGFENLPSNKSLEALARGPDGTLYAIPESVIPGTRQFQVFRYRNGQWLRSFSLDQHEMFLVTGADVGPDGRLYVLERSFSILGGFASRVRRFAIGRDGLTDETLMLETPPGRHDNLEGISVWQDDDGLRMTLISDDNQRFFQRTELVDYRLPQ